MLEYMLCGVLLALHDCLPLFGQERMLGWESDGTVVFFVLLDTPQPYGSDVVDALEAMVVSGIL